MTDELKKQPLAWNSGCYLYTWYYNSTALHHAGGAVWQKWRAQYEPLLLANQSPEGWWNVEGVGKVAAAGSDAAGADKDIYRVCLATLMLETPYRFLRLEAPQ